MAKKINKVAKKQFVKKAAPQLWFTPTKLKLLTPVPSDIDIAQAGKLKPIAQIAEEVGLSKTNSNFTVLIKQKCISMCATDSPNDPMENTLT